MKRKDKARTELVRSAQRHQLKEATDAHIREMRWLIKLSYACAKDGPISDVRQCYSILRDAWEAGKNRK